MPYDYADFSDNAVNEYAYLLSELKRAFLDRIREAGEGEVHDDEFGRFARYCAEGNSRCITFNYDDFLDRALDGTERWDPELGYGFYCPSSKVGTPEGDAVFRYSSVRLLKLHGSVNWRPKLGYANPVPLDAITRHDEWSDGHRLFLRAGGHLEPEPVIVPPVLSKSSLVEQPVLRLVWSEAFTMLQSAHEVTFIGYSFPTTDMAAWTLFSEALIDLPRKDIHVVNLAHDESQAEETRSAYRSALGDIPDAQFRFEGALSWIRDLPDVPVHP
ncbi:MAG: SIR2 family protein [Gammaproteobacteria bacterium]|nr:SIR2 family protein [Gammaproteobacteria bacterium]